MRISDWSSDVCSSDLEPPPAIRPWDESRVTDSDEEVVIKQNWTEIRRFMWNYVGIVRTTKRLERAQHRIKMLAGEVGDYYGHFRVTTDLIELRNLLQCAELIVKSALHRKESRGLHYTLDYRSEEHTSELPSLMRHSYAVFCLEQKSFLSSHPRLPLKIKLS